MKLSEVEKIFGFKNKIKWWLSFKIIGYHIFGIWWCWHYAFPVKPMTVWFFAVMYFLSGIGLTCGVHRLFSHKSYKVLTPLKIFLLMCFTTAGQNSVYEWVRDHRLHHRVSDTEADPHNARRGLFFSHIGWLMTVKNNEVMKEGAKTDMSDIENDKYVMFVSKHTVILTTMMTFILPPSASIQLWGENWRCAVAWQCFIRYLCVMHSQLSVNSLAHAYGYKPYNKNILPHQNKLTAATTLGEGWHNYHHVFPFDYKAAEFCDFFNSSAATIRFWAKMGWAYDLKEATPEMIKSICERTGDGARRKEN